jgi:hypothetical protein
MAGSDRALGGNPAFNLPGSLKRYWMRMRYWE